MTINQYNGGSKEAGIIRKVLSLEGFAIFQIYFYLQRLMRLHSDICVLFTPSEPGWPGTDALARDELNQAGGDCFLRGQDRLQQRVSTRTSSHQRGTDTLRVPKQGEGPTFCQVSGNWHYHGTTLSWVGWPGAIKVQGWQWNGCAFSTTGGFLSKKKYPVFKGLSLASHPGIAEH